MLNFVKLLINILVILLDLSMRLIMGTFSFVCVILVVIIKVCIKDRHGKS